MKLKHLMTAAMGGLVLSCQGPAAVLAADEPTASVTHAAITAADRERALGTLNPRWAPSGETSLADVGSNPTSQSPVGPNPLPTAVVDGLIPRGENVI